MNLDWNDISLNIKNLRKQKGFRSQDSLADAVPCSKSVIRDIEAVRSKASLEMLADIARVLGVHVVDLIKPAQENVKQFSPNLPEVFQFLANNHDLVRMMAALPEGHLDMYRDIVEQEYNALKDKQEDARQA